MQSRFNGVLQWFSQWHASGLRKRQDVLVETGQFASLEFGPQVLYLHNKNMSNLLNAHPPPLLLPLLLGEKQLFASNFRPGQMETAGWKPITAGRRRRPLTALLNSYDPALQRPQQRVKNYFPPKRVKDQIKNLFSSQIRTS